MVKLFAMRLLQRGNDIIRSTDSVKKKPSNTLFLSLYIYIYIFRAALTKAKITVVWCMNGIRAIESARQERSPKSCC